MPRIPTDFSFIWFTTLVLLAGCSNYPATVTMPTINPKEAGREAVAAYDANGDGMIDVAESDKAPPLKAILSEIDTNGDGKISADEIAARINQWQAKNVSITNFGCKVLYNGAPLSDATVTLVPEKFLGQNLQPASGATSARGHAMLSVATDKLPVPNLSGVYCGLYRVEISKVQNGREIVPAKYNTATILGQEIPESRQKMTATEVTYDLKSGKGR